MEKNRFEDNNLYFVTSIYLNSFLLMKNFQLNKTAKLDSGKIGFFYDDTEELHQAIEEYKDSEFPEFVTQYLKVKSIISSFEE